MAIVADYLIIRDSEVLLRRGGGPGQDVDWQSDFNLSSTARLDQRMILQFYYLSREDASDLTFRFSINGNSIRTWKVTGNYFGTLHEVIGGNNLVHGENTLEVQLVDGSGGVGFSDVVLWFQNEV